MTSGHPHPAIAIAGHEYRSATRNRVLAILVVGMVLVAAASVTIASYDFKAQIADYNSYVAQAKAAGVAVTAPPQLFPLQLLRPVIEYVQIIGAVFAIGLGYLTVARERTGNTLRLLLTRPVRNTDLMFGRLLGAGALIVTILGATALISVFLIGVLGGTWLGGGDLLRVAITFLTGSLYMLIFYALGVWLSARSRALVNGLVVALVAWLMVVLIIPQIGDTMDPDNQVPGGLFAALQVQKADEKKVLAHFSTYERIRNDLEETSLTKHFERLTFAVTGIKDKYNGVSLATVAADKRGDIAWLGVYAALLATLMWSGIRRESVTGKDT